MKWAVIVFPGSNCDEDAAKAIRETTGDEVDLMWHQDAAVLDDYDAIILPGGFSYGDYLRSGAIASLSSAVAGVKRAAKAGKLILGICNGFQVLTEAGLLPGGLLRNHHLQFRCEIVELEVANTDSPFTKGYQPGEVIRVPIAHGEGRYFADEDVLDKLETKNQVAFRYVGDVNGSTRSIAGVVNDEGNVLGLMPHPERAVHDWMGSRDGVKVFQSMHEYVTGQKAKRQAEEGAYAR